MLPILTPYFTGPFISYGQGVALFTTSQKMNMQNLLEQADVLIQSIQDYAMAQGVTKPRAQASVWHMQYTLRVLPSILACHSLLNQKLPLALNQTHWQAQIRQLQLQHQGNTCLGASVTDRYEELIFNHLSPLHDWLSDHFSIAPKVLWSNCAFRINQILSALESAVAHSPNITKDKIALLEYPIFADRNNPLYAKPIILSASSTAYKIRSECCLLHEVSNKGYCSDCPKQPNHMKNSA